MSRFIGVVMIFAGSLDMGSHEHAGNARATIELMLLLVGVILVMEVFSSETS